MDHPTLGPLVRQARERAGLSRSRLASLAGLSESTLKNVEAGRHVVSTTTLRCLIRVQELGLAPEAYAQALGASSPDGDPHAHLNAWLAPGFDPIATFRELSACYAGAGGHVEQSAAYFDHASAAAWCAIASQEEYAQALDVLPLDAIADAIAAHIGAVGIDLVALGPGDGRLETRLMLQIARRLQRPSGRFFLLDISQPLLGAPHRPCYAGPAWAHLPARRGGAGRCLSRYHPGRHRRRLPSAAAVHPAPARTARGAAPPGGGDGRRHVRQPRQRAALRPRRLCAFGSGSLLLLDYPSVFGDSDEELRRRDPWLSETSALRWRGRVHDFLCGPLRRYCPDAQEIALTPQLAHQGLAIAGSYAVEVLARVKGAQQADRVFSVFRLKRYRREEVIAALHELGWQHVRGVPYGREVGYERTLSLFLRS